MTPDELKKARARLGLTQKKLAAELCVNRQSVVRWEAGKHKIPYMLELALKELEREHWGRGEGEREHYKALAATRFLEGNAEMIQTEWKEPTDLNDLELRRIVWACLTYWNSEQNPIDERVICYSWVVRCYEARFGRTFNHSRLRRLAHLGLLTKDNASRCGTRRYYRISAPAKLSEFLKGCKLDLTSSPDLATVSLSQSPDSHAPQPSDD
jgi:DNA-binding XRE family transcriptional regulator